MGSAGAEQKDVRLGSFLRADPGVPLWKPIDTRLTRRARSGGAGQRSGRDAPRGLPPPGRRRWPGAARSLGQHREGQAGREASRFRQFGKLHYHGRF